MTKYPSQIDNSSSLPAAVDNSTPLKASLYNRLREAIIAMETELGPKPSNIYANVATRMNTMENIVGNLKIIELQEDLRGSLEAPVVAGFRGRPLSTVAPTLHQIYSWNGIAWSPVDQTRYPENAEVGQCILWDGYNYIADFYAQDDVLPPVTVELVPNTLLAEVGQTITNPSFTAVYSTSGIVSNVTLKDNVNNIEQTISNPMSFASAYSFTKNTVDGYVDFTLKATQNNRFIKTDVFRLKWVQKVYYGVSTAGQTGSAFITSLSSRLSPTKFNTFTATAGASDKIYFACRSGFGNAVFTIKNVQTSFTKTTVSVTNDHGFAENYDLYESSALNLGAVTVLVSDGNEMMLIDALANIQVYGSVLGTQGPQGIQGITGPEGPPGATGPAGPNTEYLSNFKFLTSGSHPSGLYTALITDDVIIVGTRSIDFTITLPGPLDTIPTGKRLLIKDGSNQAGNLSFPIHVDGYINPESNISDFDGLRFDGQAIGYLWDGNKWQIESSFLKPETFSVGLSQRIDSGSTVTLATASQTVFCNTNTGFISINLPSPNTLMPMEIVIKDGKGLAATSNITINGNGFTIDGEATYTIDTNYGYVRLFADGVNWFITSEG